MTKFESISEMPADDQVPWLDRASIDARENTFKKEYYGWRYNGVLHMPKFLPDDLIEEYFEARSKLDDVSGWKNAAGHGDPCPYLYIPEVRKISMYKPLTDILDDLIGMKMGLHLNLTGWVSTERAWHQDDYLNPSFVNSHYAAVWFVLRDIDVDSGPFQYVPGSNRWPVIRRDKLLAQCPGVTMHDETWPSKTQGLVSRIIEEEIFRRDAQIETFLGKKGDVLIWHGRLVHRGSTPKVPGMLRHSLISHYSAITKRTDMHNWREGCFVPGGREREWK